MDTKIIIRFFGVVIFDSNIDNRYELVSVPKLGLRFVSVSVLIF